MSTEAGSVWTVVVAAGSGSRFGHSTPKQFVELEGRRVVDWSVAAAAEVSDGIVVVLPSIEDRAFVSPPDATLVEMSVVAGGATRSESVRNGLAAVPATAAVVLVHDAARPAASIALFRRVVDTVREGAQAVVPVVGLVDTVRDTDGEPVDRAKLQAVQTPQGFDAGVLRRAHDTQLEATDDAILVTASGGHVTSVEGERWNIKLTDPTDEVVLASILREAQR